MDDLINQLAPFRPIADRVRPIMPGLLPAPIVYTVYIYYTPECTVNNSEMIEEEEEDSKMHTDKTHIYITAA